MTEQPFNVKEFTMQESPIISSNGANQVIINSGATGDVGLLMTSNTKAVSLTVANNQELTLQGGVNSFVFDASSATGGITWPDGTTQITAAAGGGAFIPFLPKGTITALNNLTLGWEFMGSEHTLHSQTNTYAWFQPFYAPFTGTYGTIKAGGSSGGSNLRLAFYSVDANDMPDSVIGSVSTDFTGAPSTVITNGGNWFNVNTAVAASAPSLVRGTKYYIGITSDGPISLAARDGVGPAFLNDTYSYWYSGAGEDPSCNLMYLNASSGAAAGDLPTSITVANLTNFAGNYETALFAVDMTP